MEEKTVAQMRSELGDFYFKKVKPNLDWMNKQRGRKRIGTIAAMFMVSGVACFSLGNLNVDGVYVGVVAAFSLIAIGIVISLFTYRKNASGNEVFDINGEDDFKDKYMQEFASIFGDLHWQDSARTNRYEDLNKYREQHIMNPFYVGAYGDKFTGSYRGVNFLIQEVDTSKNSLQCIYNTLLMAPVVVGCGCGIFLILIWPVIGIALLLEKFWHHNETVTGIIVTAFVLGYPLFGLFKYFSQPGFRGVFIEFDMNKNFEGHTFVLERAKTSNCIKFNHSKFEEVKLEDPEFMEKYKIYTTNQVEARYVLTTAFIERFKNMKVAFKAKYIRASFKDGKIIIAIDAGRDLFQMANLNTDTDSNTFVEIFNEIMSIRELINALKLNEKIGL